MHQHYSGVVLLTSYSVMQKQTVMKGSIGNVKIKMIVKMFTSNDTERTSGEVL
jgi:hypothetical protein